MRLLVFLFLIALIGIGFLRLLYRVHRLNEKRDMLNLFVAKLKRFSEQYQEQFDSDLYDWLNHRVMTVHQLAADPTFWRTFGQHFEEAAVGSAQSLVATLDEMGHSAVHPGRVMSLHSFLTRLLGVLDDSIVKIRKQWRNPLLLFSEGVLFLLGSPLLAYGWISGSPDSPFEDLSIGSRTRLPASIPSRTARRWDTPAILPTVPQTATSISRISPAPSSSSTTATRESSGRLIQVGPLTETG